MDWTKRIKHLGIPKKKKLKTCSKEESAKIFETAENIYKNLEKL